MGLHPQREGVVLEKAPGKIPRSVLKRGVELIRYMVRDREENQGDMITGYKYCQHDRQVSKRKSICYLMENKL